MPGEASKRHPSEFAGAGDAVSHSAGVSRGRPFYAAYADAYDLLITDPVEPWVEAVVAGLADAGRPAGAVLDAGCGTGRHAAALAAKGYHVDLADASPALLALAVRRNPVARALEVDLCTMTLDPIYHAVMCRGVLNDMVSDAERDAVLASFALALRPGGLLVVDVRERDCSRRRADGVARSRVVDVDRLRRLTFTSTVSWREEQLHVIEVYDLQGRDGSRARSVWEFAMRPWSSHELVTRLQAAGFGEIDISPGVGRATGDRLFVTARLAGHDATGSGPGDVGPPAPRSRGSGRRSGGSGQPRRLCGE